MFEPPVVIEISDDEAMGLIVLHGLVGCGAPASGRLCFWLADEFLPPPGAVRGSWKLCRTAFPEVSGWQADGAWIATTRI